MKKDVLISQKFSIVILEKFTHIGKKVKALRNEQNLSLHDLAKKANVDETAISNVENFRAIPDILMLNRIAIGLGISLPELIDDLSGFQENRPYILLRKEDREKLDREDSHGVDYEIILTKYVTNCLFSPVIVTIRQGTTRPPVTTNALEFIYVLSGAASTGINDEAVILNAGDVLFYDAEIPHSLSNTFDQDCVMLCIYLMKEG